MERPTAEQIKDIGEELRTTRYKETEKMAFEYVYGKYRHLFVSYDQFLVLMQICATFFASQGEETRRIREATTYKYV